MEIKLICRLFLKILTYRNSNELFFSYLTMCTKDYKSMIMCLKANIGAILILKF